MIVPFSHAKLPDGFTASWERRDSDQVTSSFFGCIVHGIVCNETQVPIYDLPVWLERSGAICVPIDQKGRIALLSNFRAVMAAPNAIGTLENESWKDWGRLSLELPRGFPNPGEDPADTACREVEEETGYAAGTTQLLDYTNTNSTYFPFSNHVYMVRIDSSRQLTSPGEGNERIEAVHLLSPDSVVEAIADRRISCGMTKSALMSYFAMQQLGRLSQTF